MNYKVFTIVLMLLSSYCEVLQSQNESVTNKNVSEEKCSICGTIVFNDSDKKAIGVQVYLDSIFIGTVTDFSGNYSITNIKVGNYTLVARYLGYQVFTRKINIDKDLVINIGMNPSPINLESISVRADRLIDKTSVSDISLVPAEIESFKGLQEDPLNVLTLMPGISKGGNDLFSATQLYIRGGAPDENLFLHDNVKVYWPWYSGGIKSVFNNEVIDKLELLTGGFGAKYGNAMSSVLRVTTRDGSYERFKGNFTFGFTGLQTTIETPIINNKVSVLVSVRKTFLDLILGKRAEFPTTNTFDGTYKIAWKVNEKHKVSLSGLSSREKLDFLSFDPEPGMPNEMNTNNTSHSQSLQIQSMWTDRFYTNTSIFHSLSNSSMSIGANLNMELEGSELGIREDATFVLNENNKIDFGIEASAGKLNNKGNSTLNPFTTDYNDTTAVLREFNFESESQNYAAYLSYSGDITPKLSATIGVRSDFLFFDNRFIDAVYSPRLSIKYRLLPKTNLRASYGYFYQSPSDEALSSNKTLASNLCTHYIVGVEHSFSSHFKGWGEVYYKDYDHLIVYNLENDSSTNITFSNNGRGFAKGVELFLMRKYGRLTSWVSYAYSVSKRKQSMQDEEYFFEYDRPHMFNLAAELKVSNKTSYFIPHLLSLQFKYESGNPYTPVVGAEQNAEGWQKIYGPINSERNPAFHCMTLKIVFLNKNTDKIRVKSFVEFWNVYNHKNVLGRNYNYGDEYENNIKINKYYSSDFMPSGGVRIEF